MNRADIIGALLPQPTQTVNEPAPTLAMPNEVEASGQRQSRRLKFQERGQLVRLIYPSQKRIKIAALSTTGSHVGLFSTRNFWIYFLKPNRTTDEDDPALPNHLPPIRVGRFENHDGKCDYYYGSEGINHQAIQKTVEICLAALLDDFMTIGSTNKTVLIMRQHGPCLKAISFDTEPIYRMHFSAGGRLVFLSTCGDKRHRLTYLSMSDFERTPKQRDVKIRSRNSQSIQELFCDIGTWNSAYLPYCLAFSADGNTIVMATAPNGAGKREIRVFRYYLGGWQSNGSCIISLGDQVLEQRVQLTGLELYPHSLFA